MGKLNNDTILDILKSRFAGQISDVSEPYGLLTFEATKSSIEKVLYTLKADTDLQFNFLTDLTAVHYPDHANQEFAVVYHLHSLTNNIRIRLRVFLDKNDLHIASATPLWEGANWMERETYDFFGIVFDGHPDLRRILNVDDMAVFPMRKEYPLEDPNRVDKKDFFFGR